jgi:DNA-binding response OmpR family regulator
MPGTILIVDDEENLRHTLAFILKRAGYYVTTTKNARDALNSLQSGVFDLMILDLKMPDVDGLSLLKMIKHKHSKMPIFILTAYGSLDSAIDALRLGARDYLLKPIDPAQLLERIQKILQEEHNSRRRDQILDQMQNLLAEFGETRRLSNGDNFQQNSETRENARFLHRGVFYIDLKARYLELDNQPVSLPHTTFSYLLTLLRHSPDPVSYQDLVLESLGKTVSDIEARLLCRWQIYQMRKLIEQDPGNPDHIITVRNVGYRLICERSGLTNSPILTK